MSNRIVYIYYFLLILILALYTNMSNSPNELFRFGYLAVLALPLVNRTDLFPAVTICALSISQNTFAYPLMPTDMFYYVTLALGFAWISLYRRNYKIEIDRLFIVAFAYVVLNSFIMPGKMPQMVSVFLIYICFFACMRDATELAYQFMSLSFILITLTISCWALFFPDAQIEGYNKLDDMEQRGWTDPNYLSIALGTGIIVAVKDLIKGGNKLLYRIVLIVTIVGGPIALLHIASRGIMVAVALSVTTLLVLSKIDGLKRLIAVIITTVFILFLYTNQYMDFILARFETDDGTANNRTMIWFAKIHHFFRYDNPFNWFFGVGQSWGTRLGGAYGKGLSTHSDYVSMLVYYGFAGFIIFCNVLSYPLKICKKSDRPQIFGMLVYLLTCSATLEPLARGNFAYWGLLFYTFLLAWHSKKGLFKKVSKRYE